MMRRLRYWLAGARREAALRAEIESHIEEATAELRERGLPEAAARSEARRRFGNQLAVQEASGEIWISRYGSEFLQDLRYGARNLKRNPGFAAVAILSAAFGVGACSTIFGVVNAAIFQALPVTEPERLMSVTGFKKGVPGGSLSYPEVRDLGMLTRSWEGIAAFSPFVAAAIASGEAPQREWGFLVTANYFDVVRTPFAAGRGFVAGDDDVPGAPAKIVLSYGLWRRRFGADRSIVGQTIRVNKRPVIVAGVTGPAFRGTEVGIAAEFFLPMSQISEIEIQKDNRGRLEDYGAQWLSGVGRLRPGIDVRQARAEFSAAARGMRERNSALPRGRDFYAERAGQLMPFLRKLAVPVFVLTLTVALLVLLTACANVANLLLARASARRREIATRLAIGAGRARLVRQLMAESLLLALAGGALGVGLAAWAWRHISGYHPPVPLPIDLSIPLDFGVLLFSTVIALATGVIFGLIPALHATNPNLAGSMRFEGGNVAGLRRVGSRNALVVAQVGISAMLVICSGLFLRSLAETRGIDSGMKVADLVLVRFDPALGRYDEKQTQRLLLDILRDIESLPGGRSATITNLLPLSLGGNFTQTKADGRGAEEEPERTAVMAVGPRYFETMGMPLLAGADFPPATSAEPLAIVNQELARRLYPGQDVIGRYVREGGRRARIVGVTGNSKYRMVQESEATPILYKPLLDSYAVESGFGGLTLIVGTTQPSRTMGESIRQRLLRRDPELVVTLAGTMESHLKEAMFLPRLAASLFGLCGVVGLLISSIGIYGVVSFAVARRRREIGIRMALGARTSQIVRMVFWHGTGLALVGLFLGVAGGAALARMARSLIYGVSATDSITFFVVPPVLLAVALLATAVPARRAATVDPNCTLRAE